MHVLTGLFSIGLSGRQTIEHSLAQESGSTASRNSMGPRVSDGELHARHRQYYKFPNRRPNGLRTDNPEGAKTTENVQKQPTAGEKVRKRPERLLLFVFGP